MAELKPGTPVRMMSSSEGWVKGEVVEYYDVIPGIGGLMIGGGMTPGYKVSIIEGKHKGEILRIPTNYVEEIKESETVTSDVLLGQILQELDLFVGNGGFMVKVAGALTFELSYDDALKFANTVYNRLTLPVKIYSKATPGAVYLDLQQSKITAVPPQVTEEQIERQAAVKPARFQIGQRVKFPYGNINLIGVIEQIGQLRGYPATRTYGIKGPRDRHFDIYEYNLETAPESKETGASGIKIIPMSRELVIRNTDQLPRGTGARYLEVMDSHIPGELIAVRWRNSQTADSGHFLIELEPGPEIPKTGRNI